MRLARVCLACVCLALIGSPALAKAPTFEAREYKILLAPGPFADPAAGMGKAWSEARKVAESLGLKVKEESLQPEDDRFVAFLDTKDFAIRKSGHILRVRRSKDFGRKGLEGRTGELTFKFRSPKPAAAGASAVAPAPGVEGETSCEEDASYRPAGVRVVYSKSAQVETDDLPPCTVDGFAKVFAGVAALGLPAGAPLGRVRGVAVREVRVKPGKVDFGPAKGKVTLSVWLDPPRASRSSAALVRARPRRGSSRRLARGRPVRRRRREVAPTRQGFTRPGSSGDESATDE
jgi:hypothetical protein